MIPKIKVHKGVHFEQWGKNAQNDLFTVEIADIVNGSWIAILAQEIFECRYKWRKLLLPVFFKKYKEEMEILGHAVEALVANELEHYPLHEYVKAEAQTMVHPESSYRKKGLFKGETVESMEIKLNKAIPEAADWIDKHEQLIGDWWHKRKTKNYN